MRVTITLRATHERESPGDAAADGLLPDLPGVRVTGGSQARIEPRIEPPAAVAATGGEVMRYAAWLAGRLEAMLEQAPWAAADATLTVEIELPERGGK